MAFTTLTRYLKLKVDSDLSADAVYNLQRIDALASTFVVDASETLNIQSKGSIEIEPNDTALGGSGEGGTINLGTDDHTVSLIQAYTSAFQVTSGISTKNQATNKTNYLKLAFESSTDSDPRQLKFDLGGTDRNISFDSSGTVVTKNSSGNVSIAGNMTATGGFVGPLTGAVTGNVSGNVTGNLTGNVTGNVSGTAANVTGIVAIANGGTGASNKTDALENLVPDFAAGDADKVLALNSTGDALEWKAAGAGQVVSIQYVTPIHVDDGSNPGDAGSAANPIISLPKADTNTDGYLSQTDWDTFNNKQDAISSSGNASQFWNGNKIFTAVTKSDVGLGNVENTSDADKQISTATQTALNAKYDASNPAGYISAAGAPVQSVNGQTAAVVLDTDDISEGTAKYFTATRAKEAVVVDSAAGSQIDQAPSVKAIKLYVDANSGPKFSTTWTVADGNSKTITHSLDTREVSITIYDENYETVYVDSETRTTVNAVDLVRVGTATGTWTVIIKKL